MNNTTAHSIGAMQKIAARIDTIIRAAERDGLTGERIAKMDIALRDGLAWIEQQIADAK
jgi:hypothetical protein